MLISSPFPLDIRRGTLDGDAPFPFQIHEIHRGADAVFAMDVMNRMNLIAVVEDTFRKRSFARVNMGGNTNVPHVLQVNHTVFLSQNIEYKSSFPVIAC
jgi:hypothetical protein